MPNVLYFLQKNVTGRSRVRNINISPNWSQHKHILQKHNATDFIFEFGAGKTLAQNLYLSNVIDNQLIVDLNPMLDFELVEQSRKSLSSQLGLKHNSTISSKKDLLKYGITYRAPFNAENTDLEDGSLSACISTNTLEHIPPDSIKKIFIELHRTLKTSGIVSAKIDYSDHYAHTDKSISLLNYLKYSDSEWNKHNHSVHYQNRLRHFEYVDLFEMAGFTVIEETLEFAESNIPDEVVSLWNGYDESWKATAAHIVLKKS